jgi:hypoxanthine phosphoribosyltransferase
MAMTMHLWKSLKVMIVQKDDSPGKTLHHPVQVLQQVHDRKINTEAQQDQQMQEILIMKGDKIQLTQKMFNSQKQDMKVRSKLKEEQLSINKQQLSLTKQDIEVRAK